MLDAVRRCGQRSGGGIAGDRYRGTADTDPGSGAGAAGSGSGGAGAAAGSGSAGAAAAIGSGAGAATGSAERRGATGSQAARCGDWLGQPGADAVRRSARARERRPARPEAAAGAGTETPVRPRRGAVEAEWERPAGPAPTAHPPAARRPRQGPPRPPSIPSPRCQPSSMSPFPHIGPKSVYWMLQFDYRNCYTCGRCDQEVNDLGQPEHVLLRSISNRPQQGPTVV